LVNDLYLLKKFGKKFIIFSSYSFLQDNPQKLSVLYTKESPKVQRIEQRKLFSDNKVDYGIVAGKLVINTTVGFSLLSRNMRSRLTGMEQVDKAENHSLAFLTLFDNTTMQNRSIISKYGYYH
jgi:hypothetical protein